MGVLFPFLVVFYAAHGISPMTMGIIESVVPFVGAASRPIVAAFADKRNNHKATCVVCIFIFSILGAALILIRPPPTLQQSIQLTNISWQCDNGKFCQSHIEDESLTTSFI